jgi:hypothetical protein
MKLLATIKREERKLEKQLGKVQHQLNRVRPRGSVWRCLVSFTSEDGSWD